MNDIILFKVAANNTGHSTIPHTLSSFANTQTLLRTQ